jgi:dTDP-glucose pyrophosphorylase
VREAAFGITAVINAGGQSQRMAASGIALHKALVQVLGVPLVERNLCVLIDQGFRDIVVVVSAKTPDVEAFVRCRAAALGAARGAVVECIREEQPLGNMGVAGQLAARAPDLLVTFVDNLTALDLTQVVTRHRQSEAALTIASHLEDFRVPHGELKVADNIVLEYVEKPTKKVRVASGVYVLASRAAAAIPPNRPIGAVDLFALLKDRGERIAAFEHNAPWIDVNDEAAVRSADRLVARNADVFERRSHSPDAIDACLLIRTASRILVVDQTNGEGGFRGRWDVVRAKGGGETERAIQGITQGAVSAETRLASFDDFEDLGGRTIRHEVFVVQAGEGEGSTAPDGLAWIEADVTYGPMELTQPLRRCIALERVVS